MYVGFDLGANCGAAVLDSEGRRVSSTTWELGKRTGSSLYTYQRKLYDLLQTYVPLKVGYERVMQNHRSRAAACAFGGYEGILWAVCFDIGVELIPVGVGSIKKAATGMGDADKEEMEAAAYGRWDHVPEDDNEADALFIADYVRLNDGRV
jgi:Holliday junction resolvasome RuvABC endonuclease subunit